MKVADFLALAITGAVSFAVGANSGFALGADTMQCVTYHMLSTGPDALVSEQLADDACKSANSWSEMNPTRLVRMGYVFLADNPGASHEAK
jgi:hypothetical protein